MTLVRPPDDAAAARRPRCPPRRRRAVSRRRRRHCTFAFHGPAISVRLVHFGVGLPDDLSFTWSTRTGEWWALTLAIPSGSRLEYKLEVTDSFGTRLIEDPLNPRTASHPFGGNSVCEAAGYATPDWAIERDDVPRGSIHDVSLDSAALGRQATTSVYLPAGYRRRSGAALPARHRPRRSRLPALRRRVDGHRQPRPRRRRCRRRSSPSCIPASASSSTPTTSAITST